MQNLPSYSQIVSLSKNIYAKYLKYNKTVIALTWKALRIWTTYNKLEMEYSKEIDVQEKIWA